MFEANKCSSGSYQSSMSPVTVKNNNGANQSSILYMKDIFLKQAATATKKMKQTNKQTKVRKCNDKDLQ